MKRLGQGGREKHKMSWTTTILPKELLTSQQLALAPMLESEVAATLLDNVIFMLVCTRWHNGTS